jgi:hypothetical protein
MIVSGTLLKHANDVKTRLESLFTKRFPSIQLKTKFTELWLKNTQVICFPSRNVKDIRGYTDVSYIFVDESDYFELSLHDDLLAALTAYEEKSKATTIMASTPNRPDGLFAGIEKEPNSKWHKVIMTYEVGLDKIYDRADIEKKKLDSNFMREYGGQYLGRIGNLLTPLQVETCINLGSKYSIDKIPVSLYSLKSVGIDPAFGSSSTGIVVLEHIKPNYVLGEAHDQDVIRVIRSELISKGNPNDIVNLLWDIWRQYNFMNTYYYIDGSNRAFLNLLKIRWNESLNWDSTKPFNDSIKIRPVNFSTENKTMLSAMHTFITKGYVAIPKKHDKLITSLRTAWVEELSLDKKETSYDDLLDALRLALKAYNIQ